jgi:DNA polymerase elongation subunit (family B)
MSKGSIIDVYPDKKKNAMITWLIDNGKSVKIEDKYTPSFYVYAQREDLYTLLGLLRDLPQVEKLNFTFKKTVLGSNKKRFVLEVFPKNIGLISKLSQIVDSWGGYYRYQLFDVDIRLPTRYLQDKEVFCNASVNWDGKNFIHDDSQWAIDYVIPNYKTAHFDVQRKAKGGILSFDDPIKAIKIDNYEISEENEVDIIVNAVKRLKQVDPDVIYTHKGDSVLFPYLYHRAGLHNIQNLLNLGRDKSKFLRPTKQAKSYFSYGQIVYRPAFYTLPGRAHLDTYNSFMYGESGLHGLIDISRCSNIPLQVLSRVGPGTAISQIQVNKARDKGYIIPWKKNRPEDWKTAMNLLVSDRGGLILDPIVGLHEDIIELDFASLYPNIMLKYNISPETMLCSCCRTAPYYIVPQLSYHICNLQKGLLPEVLEPILSRRFCYKARSKNKKYEKELFKELQQAWKWVLLVCFGYTGYRNARYGRIECYESITAFSRDIILSAVEIVQNSGYEVIHGIIDSLWVKSQKGCVKPNNLSRLISNHTGIRMDVEGRYRWIVFLPSKNTGVGALNRYYGLFDNGEIKVRGIEMRQKSSPLFLKNMQNDMLKVFSKAINAREFLELIPKSIDVVKDYATRVINMDVRNKDLLIKTCVSRDISEYKVDTLVKSALFQLRDSGVQPEPGQSVRYVVCDEKSRRPKDRVCIAEILDSCKKIDVDFYLRQIAQYAESILVPFGFTLEKLFEMLQKIKIRELLNVSVLPGIRTHQTSL